MAHAATTATSQATERQPNCPVMYAISGKNTICPVAELAVSKPMARPRRVSNQIGRAHV